MMKEIPKNDNESEAEKVELHDDKIRDLNPEILALEKAIATTKETIARGTRIGTRGESEIDKSLFIEHLHGYENELKRYLAKEIFRMEDEIKETGSNDDGQRYLKELKDKFFRITEEISQRQEAKSEIKLESEKAA